ncbi:HAD family hydrolase [Elusimicrobiota bacterium]
MDNYIFDLDGTLVDTSYEILQCLRQALNENFVEYDESKLNTDIMGPSLKEIIKLVVPELNDEKIINSVVARYRFLYDYNNKDSSKLYDGILNWLEHLIKENKKIFIATNKPKIPTMRLVNSLNINFFNDILTPDKYSQDKRLNKQEMIEDIIIKHKLCKEKTVMVGDVLSDIDSAHSAGIKAIGALWGYAKDINLLKETADFVLDKPTGTIQ